MYMGFIASLLDEGQERQWVFSPDEPACLKPSYLRQRHFSNDSDLSQAHLRPDYQACYYFYFFWDKGALSMVKVMNRVSIYFDIDINIYSDIDADIGDTIYYNP